VTVPYHVKISPAVSKYIHKLGTKHQKLVMKIIETLSINPRPLGAVKIDGLMGLYKQNLGFFHLIYKVEEQEVLVLLIK
jgi:mRNA interferase RelE/StbE